MNKRIKKKKYKQAREHAEQWLVEEAEKFKSGEISGADYGQFYIGFELLFGQPTVDVPVLDKDILDKVFNETVLFGLMATEERQKQRGY